jgi:hypothetical protein
MEDEGTATLLERTLAAEAEAQHLRKVLAFRDAFVPVQWGEDTEGRWWIVTLRNGLPHQAFHQQLGYLQKIPPDMFGRWAGVNVAESPGEGPEVASLRAKLRELELDVDWWRTLFVSLTRAMCLSDHMGDAWNEFFKAWELAGMKLPTKIDDNEVPSLEALETMGARSFWTEPKMLPLREGKDQG